MTNTYYQLYVDKSYELAETIRIKSADTVSAMNKNVKELNQDVGVDDGDPLTWKYYMNVAGEYHPTDVLMTVISIDTLEEITFSKENLEVHRATAREYKYGTRYYKELVARYPEQEDLILGILYPCDKQAAIDAEDGCILSYPTELIEINEYSLKAKLQDFIYGFKQRWVNPAYGLSDDLYPAYMEAILRMCFLQALISFRLDMCLTNEAHSFHVRQFLASHGYLDSYMDTLTTEQSLWLYKNIRYIQRNAGKQDTFHWLVDNIMTKRQLPLAEYTMRHNLSEQPADFYPTPMFRRMPVNLGYNEDAQDTISLTQMLDKEQPLAPGNIAWQADYGLQIKSAMENSLSNVVTTKALESNMFDRTDATPFTMTDILMNYWLYFASKDLYVTVISITNPKTGERMPMTAKEAYIAMFYSYCRAMGIDLTFEAIPELIAKRVPRIPRPSIDDLLSVVDRNYVDVDTAKLAISWNPIVTQMISTEAFYNFCGDSFDAAQLQRKLMGWQQHHKARGHVHGMISRIYCDKVCKLDSDALNYDQWFSLRNFKLVELSDSDHALLYLDIVRNSTGLNLSTTKALKDLQLSMTQLMGQLSSYSIQFMSTINTEAIKVFDWPVIRLGDVRGHGSHYATVIDEVVGLKNVKGKGKHPLKFDISKLGPQLCIHGGSHHEAHMEIIVKPHTEGIATRGFARMLGAPIYINPPEPPQVNLDDLNKNLTDFSYMTVEERQGMIDIYNSTAPGGQ